MKIIVFFIIVVISSCYADAQLVPKMECQQKMGRSQAEDIGAQLAQLLKLHVQMKDSGDQCAMRCFREKIFSIMDVMATVTGCPCQVIARLMVTYLPAPWKEDAAKIEDTLMRRDGTALNSTSFTEDAMTPALMKTADAVLVAQDHNTKEMVEKGVLSLAATSTAQEINKIKRFFSELVDIALDLEVLEINDVPILQSGNSAVEIGGARKPVNIYEEINIDAILANLRLRRFLGGDLDPDGLLGGAGGGVGGGAGGH